MCGSNAFRVLGLRQNHSQGLKPWKQPGIAVSVLQCTKCRLNYSSPMPIPYDIQDHYGTPPENYWVPNYFEINPEYFKYSLNTLQKLKPVQPGMKALDIGAGIGKCMIAMQTAGFDVWGFEPSKPFHERAITRMNIPADRIVCSTVEDASYENNFFDFITFGAVLEHLYYPAANIEKAMKWLRPGGIMHIEVPSSDWLMANLLNLYYKLRGSDFVSNISPMHTPFHLYEFTLESFEAHAAKHGYEIIFHERFAGNTYAPGPLKKVLTSIMNATGTGMQLTVWLRKK